MSEARDKHVKRELGILGHTKEVIKAYRDVGDAFDVLIKVVSEEAIANGDLEPITLNGIIGNLLALLDFQNLSPLTDDPDEWSEISMVLYQSKRNPNAFSTTQGSTYYLLAEKDRKTKTFPVHISEHKVIPPPPPPIDPPPVDPPPVDPDPEDPPPVEEPPPPPVDPAVDVPPPPDSDGGGITALVKPKNGKRNG
jgi:hypothetical protein